MIASSMDSGTSALAESRLWFTCTWRRQKTGEREGGREGGGRVIAINQYTHNVYLLSAYIYVICTSNSVALSVKSSRCLKA